MALSPANASLISATPIVQLLDTLRHDIERIRARTPNAPDLATLTQFRDDLGRALAEAHRTEVWVTPKRAHELTGCPISTITRWCKDEGDGKWAFKKAGWRIHWPSFEAWLRTRQVAA